MAAAPGRLGKRLPRGAVVRITLPPDAPLARGRVDQLALSLHPDLEAGLLADIRDHADAHPIDAPI
jgi:hypothetical protein